MNASMFIIPKFNIVYFLNINKTELCKQAKISTNAMAKMGRNESVPLETLVKICDVLKCTLNDVVEIKSKEENNGDN